MPTLNKIIKTRSRFVLIGSLGTIAMAGLLHYYSHIAFVKLKVNTSSTTNLKIYWTGEGQHYDERRSKTIPVYPKKENYTALLTNLGVVNRLRIDPTDGMGVSVRIKSIAFYQDGFEDIRIHNEAGFKSLRSLHDIKDRELDDTGLTIVSEGADSQLEYGIRPVRTRRTLWANGLRLLAMFTLIALPLYLVAVRQRGPLER